MLERFTEARGDRTRLHSDETPAQASRSGGIVGRGGETSALLDAVVAEEPGTALSNVDGEVAAPVRPGDTVPGAVEVRDAREDDPIATVTPGDARRS